MPPLIISASRRTDLPAYYPDWFMGRVRAGFCRTRNPFSRKEIKVSLAPKDVASVVGMGSGPNFCYSA